MSDDSEGIVPKRSYAFYRGVNPQTKRYGFKFLTLAGRIDFERFTDEFEKGDINDIFTRLKSQDWRDDPALKAIHYFNEIVELHESGRGELIMWDPGMYNLYLASKGRPSEAQNKSVGKISGEDSMDNS